MVDIESGRPAGSFPLSGTSTAAAPPVASPTTASPAEALPSAVTDLRPRPPHRLIHVVLADDHAVVRDGLRALVAAQRGLLVVGEAGDGQEAWQRARELRPDVMVLDLSMPRMGGTDAAERISRDCPSVRVVVLTMHEERGYVLRVLRAGAAGYVLKRSASAELVRAIRVVAGGGMYVDPSLAGALLAEQSTRSWGRPTTTARSGEIVRAELTGREEEVLRLVARGHSNKEIAQTLEVSVKTVETHKAHGMAKLGLTSRAALVHFALDEGWLSEGNR